MDGLAFYKPYDEVEGHALDEGDRGAVEVGRRVHVVDLQEVALEGVEQGLAVLLLLGLAGFLGGIGQVELVGTGVHGKRFPDVQQVVGGIADRCGLEGVGEAEAVLVEAEHLCFLVVYVGIELAVLAGVVAAEHVGPDWCHDVREAHVGEVVFDDEPQVAVHGIGGYGIQVGQHLGEHLRGHGRCRLAQWRGVLRVGVLVERVNGVLGEFLHRNEQHGGVYDEFGLHVSPIEQLAVAEGVAQVGGERNAASDDVWLVGHLMFGGVVGHGEGQCVSACSDVESG